MGPLAALERFFERLFERQSARLFRTKLQPIQLQRRVERAMESDVVRDGARRLVPTRYAVHLAPADLAALRQAHPSLAADLADAALGFARGHGYTLGERPTVGLIADPRVDPGDVRVEAGGRATGERATGERAGPAEPPDDGAPTGDGAPAAPGTPETGTPEAVEPGMPPVDRTAVFVVPTPNAPRATLRVVRPDGASTSFTVDGRPLTIGRAPDNGLVVHDGRASRRHARIFARAGSLLLADLGSTNGSWVNDRRVEEMALGEGDRIRIGDTILIVESVEDA
jgi:hypothetical protein